VFGRGTASDEEAGVRLIRQSAETGCLWGIVNLGWVFLYGAAAVTTDEAAAASFFKLAADRGDAAGQYQYGWCLLNGVGVPKNEPEGARLVKLAADQGYVVA
jgi:TPR repeat protein